MGLRCAYNHSVPHQTTIAEKQTISQRQSVEPTALTAAQTPNTKIGFATHNSHRTSLLQATITARKMLMAIATGAHSRLLSYNGIAGEAMMRRPSEFVGSHSPELERNRIGASMRRSQSGRLESISRLFHIAWCHIPSLLLRKGGKEKSSSAVGFVRSGREADMVRRPRN